MNRTVTNAVLVLASALLYIGVASYSGRIALNDGLGPDGPVYAAMVTAHDVGGGTVGHRVWPAFPLAAAAVYAVTGNLVNSFAAVNGIALLLLAFAACVILDAHAAPLLVKASIVLTLGILGIPTAMTAYNPVQPYLSGLALAALAVAACESANWFVITVTQGAATLGSPVGIIAPLYGLARTWRTKQRGASDLLPFVPALLLWLLIQTWARGGPAGLLDLLSLSRVYSDAILWTESAFMLFGAYFTLTSLAGLTVLLWSQPRWIADAVRERPELWALVLPVIVFMATAGLEVTPMIAFLIPFWLVVLGMWARRQTSAPVVPMMLAGVVTLLSQHPWSRMTDVSYFADWFPYSVHAARVSAIAIDDAALTAIWRPRVLIAAAGLAAFVMLWRRSARSPRGTQP